MPLQPLDLLQKRNCDLTSIALLPNKYRQIQNIDHRADHREKESKTVIIICVLDLVRGTQHSPTSKMNGQ